MIKFLSFDGAQGRVEIPGYKGISGAFDGPVHRSITFWIRTVQSGTEATICWWGDDLTQTAVDNGSINRVRLLGDRVEIFGRGSGRQTASGINDGNWHHIAFTYDPGEEPNPRIRNFANAHAYVDGVLNDGLVFEDGVNNVNTAEESEVIIGARPFRTGGFVDFFQGDLDEIAVYRDEISFATITGSYNNGVRGVDLRNIGQWPALQFWFRMGDDPGDTVPSGVLYSGTLVDNSFYGRNGVTFSGTTIGI